MTREMGCEGRGAGAEVGKTGCAEAMPQDRGGLSAQIRENWHLLGDSEEGAVDTPNALCVGK